MDTNDCPGCRQREETIKIMIKCIDILVENSKWLAVELQRVEKTEFSDSQASTLGRLLFEKMAAAEKGEKDAGREEPVR